MPIPTELVGSLPRPMRLQEAYAAYDEGEDFWPKRYAIWGRLVAQQPGQTAWSIIDQKAIGRFMPPVFPGVVANDLGTHYQAIDASVLVNLRFRIKLK